MRQLRLSGVDWLSLSGIVTRGHQVASRQSEAYAKGTIELQCPFFSERGLDLSGFYSGTLNILISPYSFKIATPEFYFPRVEWTSKHPPEDFSFSACRVIFNEVSRDGWIYYPHPETKIRHHQNHSVIEVIAPYIRGLKYGDVVELQVKAAEVVVSRDLEDVQPG